MSDQTHGALPAEAGGVPAGRYGPPARSGRPVAALIAVGLLAAAGLGWLVWAALYHATPPVRATLVGYTVTSDQSVTVRFEIVKDTGYPATCRVRARDRAGVQVGEREVTIPAGTREAVVSEELRTRQRAITGEVRDCRLVR